MTSKGVKIDCGPFAETRNNIDNFCHNLFLSHAISRCAEEMIKAQKEYDNALIKQDKELIEKKRIELQTYQSSLTLTAYMFDEIDEVIV